VHKCNIVQGSLDTSGELSTVISRESLESEAWTALEELPRFLETRIGGDAEVHVAE
jgi:hypothetical protein